MDWLANGSPPWAEYRAFISGQMIALDKHPGERPAGVGETWRRIFANIVLKIALPEAHRVCQNDQLRAELKAGIDGAIQGVQDIWDKKLTTEDWGFFS